MNTIIAIGFTSEYECFLNISKEDVIQQYCQRYWNSEYPEDKNLTKEEIMKDKEIKEIEFYNHFSVYDI